MSHRALPPELLAAIDAGACILTLSQRSSHRLRVLFANHAIANGLTAWRTPNIQSFNTFALRLWRENSKSHERILSAEQGGLIWERIVDESHWSRELLSPQAAASSSYRSWELMQSWQLTNEAVVAAAAHSGSDEAKALIEWSERFAALCKGKHWLPIQCLPQRLLDLTLPTMHIVTLTDELVPIQRLLLNRMESNGSRWSKLSLTQLVREVKVTVCETSEAELQAAATWAEQQVSLGIHSVGIAVPQLNQRAEEVRRVFAEVFAQPTRTLLKETEFAGPIPTDREQQEASFAIAHYRSLTDFPVTCAAVDLLKLAEGRASGTLVSAILRSPFVAGHSEEQHVRALLDVELRKQSREYFDFVTLARIATTTVVFTQQLHNAQSLRMQWPTRAQPSVWAESFLQLWRAFGWPGDQPLNSGEQQLLARFQEALAEFGALDDIVGLLSPSGAIRQFDQHLRSARFEPRSRPAPITIVDPLNAEGLMFDAFWCSGMDESRWPPPPQPDPFIPLTLQITAGIPNASARLSREHARACFNALISMADTVMLSYPKMSDDVEVMPSAWIQDLPRASDGTITYAAYATRIYAARPAPECIDENNAPMFAASKAKGGSRLFELQSQCPFRAFAELRLGAVPLEESGPEIDARTRGTLMHAALADIWNTVRDSTSLQSRSSAELQTLIRTTLARHSSKLLEGASAHRVRMLQIEQDIATERIMALMTIDRQRTPFQIVGKAESAEVHQVGPLRFELRLDRVDELISGPQSGSRVIVDYKTGNNVSATSWSSDRPEQPQLPLYAVTHSAQLGAVSFVTLGAKGIAYKGEAIDDNILPGVKGYANKKSVFGSWSTLLDHWRTVIERLANEFAQGIAHVDPLPNACQYCHLKSVCRVTEQREMGRGRLVGDGTGS